MADMIDQTAEGCLQEILENNPNPTATDVIQALSAKGFTIEGGGDTADDYGGEEEDGKSHQAMKTSKDLDNMAEDAASKAFGG